MSETAAHLRAWQEDPQHWDDWERLAQAGDLSGAIAAYVRAYDWVSFPELLRKLEPHVPGGVRGEWAITLPDDPNLILWTGMSAPFLDAMRALRGRSAVFFHPARVLTYAIDGGLLRLPLARRLPKRGYTTPHWVPVCLRPVPLRAPAPGRKTAGRGRSRAQGGRP